VGRGNIVLVVAKTMRNPRSALCKTAIMAAADIFNASGDKLLDPETSDAFDGLVLGLRFFLCDLFSRIDSLGFIQSVFFYQNWF